MIRKGREFYGANYNKAIGMYNQGEPIQKIAENLKISYSCVYHWVKNIRKPELGNVNEFSIFLEKNGPMAVMEIKDKFPKHNELFLIANRRGLKIKRTVLKRNLGDFNTWYFLEGQENILEKRLEDLYTKVKKIRNDIKNI